MVLLSPAWFSTPLIPCHNSHLTNLLFTICFMIFPFILLNTCLSPTPPLPTSLHSLTPPQSFSQWHHPQGTDGKFCICGVHLPDAENYDGLNERALSVALGYVVHVVVLLSQLLNLPLRYPLRPYGSTATIKDTASQLLADTARE